MYVVSFTIKATFTPRNNPEYPFAYIRKNGPYSILGDVKVKTLNFLPDIEPGTTGRYEGK
jgi:hypothetical protein